ncbi:MAG: metal-dependent hydrolase [Candidatus Micrarchaeota archaeon]
MAVVRFLGHSFFRISFKGCNVLIDPFIKEKSPNPDFMRLEKTAAKEKDFKNVDIVLISNEHFDHFEKELVEKIVQDNGGCVVGHESLLRQMNLSRRFMQPLGVGQSLALRKIRITGMPAHHPPSFYPLGFLLEGDGQKIYHAGDTELLDEFELHGPDLVLLPIGGYQTMDCVDAVRAVKSMKPTYAIPMHYNTFAMMKADPNEFKSKIEKSILKTKPIILKPGQSFKF